MYFIMGFLSGGGRGAEDEWICICSRIFKISALWLVVEIPSFNFTKINKNIPPPRNPKQSDEYSTLLYSHRKIPSITIRTFSIFYFLHWNSFDVCLLNGVMGGALCPFLVVLKFFNNFTNYFAKKKIKQFFSNVSLNVTIFLTLSLSFFRYIFDYL